MQRFREIENKWFSLVLSDQQSANAAFQGLLPHLKEKYASQEFESISQMVHRMSSQTRAYKQRKNTYQKKINYVEYSDSSNSESYKNEVGLAEWIKNNKKLISWRYR